MHPLMRDPQLLDHADRINALRALWELSRVLELLTPWIVLLPARRRPLAKLAVKIVRRVIATLIAILEK